MKKLGKILAGSILALTLVACSGGNETQYKDGTYLGEAPGYDEANPIKLEVTVEGGKMTAIEILEHGESVDKIPAVKDALETLPKAIVNKGSTDLDVVAGATATSNGIKTAVDKALEEAK